MGDLDSAKDFNIESGHKIQEPDILFEKVEIKEEKEVRKDMVSFEDFQKLDMRVGRIEEIQDIEKSDNLYKLQIDVGGETKQSVAGLKGSYSPEDLEGSKVPVLVNLEPSDVMGIESECMILAAVKDEKPVLLGPDQDVDVGTEIK